MHDSKGNEGDQKGLRCCGYVTVGASVTFVTLLPPAPAVSSSSSSSPKGFEATFDTFLVGKTTPESMAEPVGGIDGCFTPLGKLSPRPESPNATAFDAGKSSNGVLEDKQTDQVTRLYHLLPALQCY